MRWIADNQEVIREQYSGKDLDETLAIITPYSQQKGLLMKALRSLIGDELANEVTIGTVYSLQGRNDGRFDITQIQMRRGEA